MADRLVMSYPDGHELRVQDARPPQYITRWRIVHPAGCQKTTPKDTVHASEAEAMVQLVRCQVEPTGGAR